MVSKMKWQIAVAILAQTVLVFSFLEAQGAANEPNQWASLLASNDRKAREAALAWLRHEQVKLASPLELSNKYAIFLSLLHVDQPGFAYRASHFLGQLPEDSNIVERSHAILHKVATTNEMLCALAYLENARPQEFTAYFAEKTYTNVPTFIARTFASSEPLRRLIDKYHLDLIANYLAWKPSLTGSGIENPFRQDILRESASISHAILGVCNGLNTNRLSRRLILIMGEIGSSDFFDVLLREYRMLPNDRTAISIASCIGSLQVLK